MKEKINLISGGLRQKKSFKEFWGFRALNIQSFKKNGALEVEFETTISLYLLITYEAF